MKKRWEDLAQEEISELVKEGHLNGAGESKGIDFDPIIEALKGAEFAEEAKQRVWYPHDYRYLVGKHYINKLIADVKMFFDLYSILEDYDVFFKERLLMSLSAFFAVLLFGNKAFYGDSGKHNNSADK